MISPIWLDAILGLAAICAGCGLILLCLRQLRESGAPTGEAKRRRLAAAAQEDPPEWLKNTLEEAKIRAREKTRSKRAQA